VSASSQNNTPTFETDDRVINRPGSWDRGQVPGTVRSTHTHDDGRVLVHVTHDDGCFTSWGAEELLELCEDSDFAGGQTHSCVREYGHKAPHRSAAGVEWESFGERFAEVVAELLTGADDAVYAALGRGMIAIRAEWPDSFTISDIDVIATAFDIDVSELLERVMSR
jgi:hypothetical protein